MQAIRLDGPFQVEVVEVPEPDLGPGQAKVKVAFAGICGSDVHRYEGNHYVVRWPSWPGHECSGTVLEVSSDVDVPVGQKVVVMPVISCGLCAACVRGDTENCANGKVLGAHMPGCFTEILALPASMLRPLPENVSLEEGAMAEPTAVAVHCVNRGQVGSGDRIAVLGAGSIGLLIQQVARARGAVHALATGRSEEKMQLARLMGPTRRRLAPARRSSRTSGPTASTSSSMPSEVRA